MAVAAWWFAVLATGTEPRVAGQTVCPSVAEVIERLTPMLALEAVFPSNGFVELADVLGRTIGLSDIEIRLQVAGRSAPLAVRRVERLATCSQTADAIAVIAASWAGSYGTIAPARQVEHTDAPPPVVAAPGSRAPPPSRAPATVRTVLSFGTSGGVVAGMVGGVAPLGGGEFGVNRGRWTLRVGAAETAERTLALPPGSAAWHRLSIIPSLAVSAGSQRMFFEVGGGPVLALTTMDGRGFALNTADTALELGLTPSLRLGVRLGALPLQVWLGESAFVWLRPHYVSVAGLSTRATLPRFETSLSAGVTVSFGA